TIQMAKTWLDLDDPEKARTVIMRLLDEKPQARTAKLTRQLARTWASYDDVKARALLLEALRDEPSADTYILLAELKTRQGNPEHALAAYREALEMAPDLITTRFTLVELLKKEGLLDEAITHLEIIKKQEPDNPLAHELLGDTYLEQGEHQKALDAFTQAMEVSEPTEKLLLKSARLELYELNQIKHAVKNFERVLQINPEHAETHYMLGFALKDLDQFERAKLEFAAYLRITPDGEHTQEVEEALAELEKKPQELK
ncbi:MAG: tetratricopeptide repeat protein, partial [Myxococcota bacterium]|nr:tetratricopeptide repeat protein [Myxococcota bacterium]